MKFPLLILVFLLVFLVLPLTSAQDELIFKYNQEIDFKRTCLNNGTFCSSSALCNLTLMYPDGTLMVNNQVMSSNGSFWNITIAPILNNQLGIHKTIVQCTDGTTHGAETLDIIITGDGKPPQDFPIQFGVILFGFFLIVSGFVNERLRLFKHLGAILIMILGILTIYPGYSFINWTTLFGKSIGFVLIGGGFYFLIEDNFSRREQQEGYEQSPEEVDDGRFYG